MSAAVIATGAAIAAAQCEPPPPTRTDPVADVLHGDRIEDPYRWLEDASSPEVARWVEAQNAYTRRRLDPFPGRLRIVSRLAELLAIGSVGQPSIRGGRRFYVERSEASDQPVLRVERAGGGEARSLLDPSPSALDWWYPSPDGRLVACGLSSGGTERSVLSVRDVETGRDLPDRIEHCRSASVGWLPDGRGFYYTRFPSEGASYGRHVRYHAMGTDPEADPVVFGEGREATEWPSVEVSPDGRHLLVQTFHGWSRSDLLHRDVDSGGPFRPLVQGLDALSWGSWLGDRVLLATNHEAPRYRIVLVDPARPEPSAWEPFLPEGEAIVKGFSIGRGHVLVSLEREGISELLVLDRAGRPVRSIDLPGPGTVEGYAADPSSDEALFVWASFFEPPALYRVDLASGAPSIVKGSAGSIDASAFEIERVRYRSKDGTFVPMSLVHRKGIAREGSNPTLLTGYGGFGISQAPAFSRNRFLWLERGGVLAIPSLRGGGELGDAWHRAGMLDRKENTFDDFVAAAEWLVENRYTRPDRLAIQGASNGGLLVGVALTRRPELFRAVVCSVPLLDMLRYDRFLMARIWVPEYGSAEAPDAYRWLRAYSPYHHVEPGRPYPSVLLTAGAADTRVDPCHARKMAARLQAATASGRPVLLRVEAGAGHGAGNGMARRAEELADEWTFLFQELGIE